MVRLFSVNRLLKLSCIAFILLPTFQFIQLWHKSPFLSIETQFNLQFEYRPPLNFFFGVIQFIALLIILQKYNIHQNNVSEYTTFRKSRLGKLAEGYLSNQGKGTPQVEKIVRSSDALQVNEKSKNVTSLLEIRRKKNEGGWLHVFPRPHATDRLVRKRTGGQNEYLLPKVFSFPVAYRFKEKKTWDQNINRAKYRYYLYFSIVFFAPIYQILINTAYITGMPAQATEWLWNVDSRLFSLLFLFEIFLNFVLLRSISGASNS